MKQLPPIIVSSRMRYCMSRVLSLALGITFDCFDRPPNVSSPEIEADSVHRSVRIAKHILALFHLYMWFLAKNLNKAVGC